eukprot:scaffold14102_cov42-Prasinocladus_malaysianus.AAC.1
MENLAMQGLHARRRDQVGTLSRQKLAAADTAQSTLRRWFLKDGNKYMLNGIAGCGAGLQDEASFTATRSIPIRFRTTTRTCSFAYGVGNFSSGFYTDVETSGNHIFNLAH